MASKEISESSPLYKDDLTLSHLKQKQVQNLTSQI